MKKKVSIYIATHKKAAFPKFEEYFPIQVGAEQSKDNFGYLLDNTNDNISIKNKNYCELTALYWIWKNSQSDIVGMVHYRRYFFNKAGSRLFDNIIRKNEILDILEKYDCIVPKKMYIAKSNLKEQYGKIHNIDDLNKCEEIIKSKYPDYQESFSKVMQQKHFYAFNMFIMSKKLLNKYAQWLFDILFELEKYVQIQNYDNYNNRIYGFLSERLFNVWIEKNKIKIKEESVYNIEQNVLKQDINRIIKKVYCRGK